MTKGLVVVADVVYIVDHLRADYAVAAHSKCDVYCTMLKRSACILCGIRTCGVYGRTCEVYTRIAECDVWCGHGTLSGGRGSHPDQCLTTDMSGGQDPCAVKV